MSGKAAIGVDIVSTNIFFLREYWFRVKLAMVK